MLWPTFLYRPQSFVCRCVAGVVNALKSPMAAEWRMEVQALSEALSDTNDCVQYLEELHRILQNLTLGSGEHAVGVDGSGPR